MLFHIDLPTNIEGDWELKDKDGKQLLNGADYPGAVLVISPYFYQGKRSQVIGRTVAVSTKGRRVRQLLRLGSMDGICRLTNCDKPKRRVIPKFDELGPVPEPVEKKGNTK